MRPCQQTLGCVLSTVLIIGVSTAQAQTSSLWQADKPVKDTGPLTIQGTSPTYIEPKPPHQIKIHDIVSVRVDVLSRMTAEGELQRRKNARYDARLKDWIVFKGLRAIGPAPQEDGDQRIRGELQSDYRSQGDMQTRESLALNVGTTVVDIRPNGNLVLEGHQKVRINEEVWVVSLTGECAVDSIGPDNVVLSRDMAHLDINKTETGSVAAGYQRGWFQKLFDVFIQPF